MAANVENILVESITKEFEYIIENIDPGLYCAELLQDSILSREQFQNIGQARRNEGEIGQARSLINIILQKPESQVHAFLAMMRVKEGHVWDRVEAMKRGVESGEIPLHHKINVTSLTESLAQMYQEKDEWRKLEPIPGERITQGVFMKPVFNTQTVDTGKQDIISFANDVKYKYIECDNLEDIFGLSNKLSKDQKLSKEVDSNLLTVAGVAGVGKTTAMHRMVWDWANKGGKIHDHFDLVFLIPVRKTKQDQKILDIMVNLGFLPHQEKEAIHEYMNIPQCAGKVLFIFDGADESELPQDIGQIILGELYPGSTVIVTMRPEAESIKSLGALNPIISVSLQGTNEESVHNFIHTMLQNKDKSQVEALYQKCKESMYDFKLLCIPLYLMLICLVFREESFSISTFSVPSTMTDLFNMIFHVIINRWVERSIGNVGRVTFQKNPLEAASNIPVQIKRILLSISNLCYNGLCDNKYEFYQNDLDKFCLSSDDIVKSGLFHVSGSGDNLLIYLKHKQLQEYLAAMYVTYQGHKTMPCSHLFQQSEHKQSLAQAVGAQNLIKTIQFCCGMSQRFCEYIFTTAIKCCVIEKGRSGSVDVYYEASLVQESQSQEMTTLFQKYLLQSEIKESSGKSSKFTLSHFQSYQNVLTDVTTIIPLGDAIQLLKTLYGLEITEKSSNLYKIKHVKTKILSKESKGLKLSICLDQLSLELLSRFTFPQVETVQVRTKDTAYIDMCVINDIFPAVRSVDIAGFNTVPYKCVRGAETHTQVTHSKLTHMTIYSLNDLYLPDDDLELILNQPNLSSLYMNKVYALDSIGRGAVRCSLSALGELGLFLFTPHTEPSSVTGLCKLLQSCPQLHTLRLGVSFSDDVDVTRVLTQVSHMTHLTHMHINIYPNRHTRAMLNSVSDLPRLSHLSTPVSCIRGVEEEVTRSLCRSRSLRSLTVWDWGDSERKLTGYTFPPHCVHTLRTHRITGTVKPLHRANTLDEAIMIGKNM